MAQKIGAVPKNFSSKIVYQVKKESQPEFKGLN